MRITRNELVCIGILIVISIISAYFYPQMPQRMATHWDFWGNPNGYMQRLGAIILMPLILLAFNIAAIVVPRVASVWANIEALRKFFSGLNIILSVLLLLVQYHIILWNIGIKINPGFIAMPMIVVLLSWIIYFFYKANRKANSL